MIRVFMLGSAPCRNSVPQLHVINRRKRHLRVRSRPVECDPVPHKLSATSVRLCRPARNIDGLALFELCQTRPELTELTVSAASFESPMRGQWNLRRLQKLDVEFEQPSELAIEELQHADKTYI